ncbi:MAG: FG-GAP-like repeat-containing protein [Candidatus Krumholzibacteriota bacterium]|nr:FG-GAP-like repeat-containing protein [Candidatus Krumholzibacteriota bacterium]
MKEVKGLRGAAVFLSLSAFLIFSCSDQKPVENNHSAPENIPPSSSGDSSRTILFFDFEDKERGHWTIQTPGKDRKDLLFTEIVEATKYNNSEKILHFGPVKGESSGEMIFVFEENGIENFPLTRDIQMAWAWNVSRVEDMNGVWIFLSMLDTRTGKSFRVRAANHTKYMHDCMETYDPPRCWCFNSRSVYDFVWRRYGPFKKGDIIVNKIGMAAYGAESIDAWVDNIWVGHGPPPEYVNTISDSSRINVEAESKMTGFSYAYIDHDDIPDRVEVYRERADIFINPHSDESSGGGEGRISNVRVTPDMSIKLGSQRGDAVVTPADLNGDGHSDLLFQFDDLYGNVCFINDYLKGSFREFDGGALNCPGEHGSGTAAADMDGDTDLDIFMFNGFRRRGNFGGVRVFRNEGGLKFTDWTEKSYLLSEGSFGGVFADFNNDGFSDLLINYKPVVSGRRRGMINFNDGTGRFKPSLEALKDPGPTHFNVCATGDFDNDADLDIYCASDFIAGSSAVPSTMMFRNNGDGTFHDVTDSSGAGCRAENSGVVTGDFNLDGFVDIYLINGKGSESILYLNNGDGTFSETERFTFLMFKGAARAAAALDFDLDGDLDLVMLTSEGGRLSIRENIGDPDNFLEVRLRGEGKNRFGIGGKVYIYQAGHLDNRKHLIGYREITQNACRETKRPPVAHFGLGAHELVDLKVVFPPAGGGDQVVKTIENVKKGSFLNICQSESFFGKVFCGHRADQIRDNFVYYLFRIPLWFFSLLVFSVVLAAGVWIRDAVGAANKRLARITAVIAAGILAVLLVYRSFAVGIAVIITAVAIIIFIYRLEEFFRGFFMSSSRRSKLEELLFDDLSQAIHTEKKFSFLGDMARKDSELDYEQIRKDFKSLDNMTSAMRMISPADSDWRVIRKEIEKIKEISGRLISDGKEKSPASPDLRIFKNSLERLNSMLEDYRLKLRMKYSIKFMDEWNALKGEYRTQLKEEQIELEEEFPDDIGRRSAHLLHDEFRHIFKNMFENSIHALRDVPEKKITVSGRYEVDYLVLRWRDSGEGLPPGMEDDIFISPVRSNKPGGMGEGCYQSGRILARRGGRIRAENTPGGSGTDFIMKIVVF